jgi:cation diffusion facilitator family transporter
MHNRNEHKNDVKDAFKSQQKVAFIGLLSELPNLIAVSVSAVLSGSLMLALDAFDSFCNTSQTFLSFFLSKKLQGDDSFKYDYGMGKIEAFGSFASSMFLFIGLAVVLTASVFSFINPSKPEEALLFAICVKIINVAIDIWLLRKQMKTVIGAHSEFIESNVMLLKKNLAFDSVTLLTIAISYIFRAIPEIVYLDPIVCVGCVLYIGTLNVKIIKESASDLLDKTLEEKTQMQILKCVSKIWGDIDGFHGVRTRRSGHIIYIDLMVSFDPNKSYSAIYKAYETFDLLIKEILPSSVSSIIIGEYQNKGGTCNDH